MRAIKIDTVKYQLRVKGLRTPDGTISVRALLFLLHGITECAEKRLRLAIEGVSVQSGRPPNWLTSAVELRVTGLEKGSTILDLEAPTLGSAIGDQIKQQDFWIAPPDPKDTALTLLASSVQDTTAENPESDFYDAGVLKSFLSLKPFLKSEASSIELRSEGRPREDVMLTLQEMEKAERLRVRIPEPQSVVVSGQLDAIHHSTKQFQLALTDGQIIPGRINEEHLAAENMREFWGKEVTIRGTMHFKPSGRAQLLAAELIKLKEAGEELFQYVPRVQTEACFVSETTHDAERRDWLHDLWGKWPGDEPVEEILFGVKE